MKTKLLTICLLLVTSQVFAEMKSIIELRSMDREFVFTRCTAISLAISSIAQHTKNDKIIERNKHIYWHFVQLTMLEMEKKYTDLSEKEVIEKFTTIIDDITMKIIKDINTNYDKTGKHIFGYVKEDLFFCNEIHQESKQKFLPYEN